ncbi:MAG: homocysteine biosynthesis protein [Euryarchaeota archaeon]|nr:homocysteine biosynthesis protein [Euryarchaeota archaeon]
MMRKAPLTPTEAFSMSKTYEEINERIRNKEAVVMTAEEIIEVVDEEGVETAAEEVDVVTTATFGPMCSSGAFINVGHANPKIKIRQAWFNDVPAYSGIAAVDIYLGATEIPENDPANAQHPGRFAYGGGHAIEDLIAGKEVHLRATAYGTDCYPRRELDTWVTIDDLNEAYLCNPRNSYQNYNVAVNVTNRTVYTYMGALKPNLGNATYCSAGQLSPLLNDPLYKTIGIGTRIWIGGAHGYVYWQGTQHSPNVERNEKGVPVEGAGALGVIGNMKEMDAKYVVGASHTGYGVNLFMGIGIPIPILNEEMVRYTTVTDADIEAPIIDYGDAYPHHKESDLGSATYAELKSGSIAIKGKDVPTAALSSYPKAVEIASTLKEEIEKGEFPISEPVQLLPQAGSKEKFKKLTIRKRGE